MAHTLPAMKGRMGDTEYYLLSLKASELVTLVREPKNMPGWDDEKIEEIYQRKINYTRVRNQIAPYLASHKTSRFFGALIVAAFNFDENVHFTSLMDLPAVAESKLTPEQKEAGSKIGMLTLGGGVMMVPLDGQHRLKALDFAIRGKDEAGKDIPGIDVDPALANEDISVILVAYRPDKARQIFTRVNRYARRPTTSETYVTDDDDIFAILARRVANDIGGRLVKYTQPSLTSRDPEFTTLAILHACCRAIVEHSFPVEFTNRIRKTDEIPSQNMVDACEKKVLEVWNRILKKIHIFSDATADRSEEGDALRKEIRNKNLLGKPVVQECLVSAYLALVGSPTRMKWETACQRLSRIPWEINPENVSQVWQNVLWLGGVDGKIITKNRAMGSRLISYMAGEALTSDELESLRTDYLALFPEEQRSARKLPSRVDDL